MPQRRYRLNFMPQTPREVDLVNAFQMVLDDIGEKLAEIQGIGGRMLALSNDLDLQGKRIRNIGTSTADDDLVPRRELKERALYAGPGETHRTTRLIEASGGIQVPVAVQPADAIPLEQLRNLTAGNADTLDDLDSTAFLILAGQAGGQTAHGGTASGEDLRLRSTAHATKGSIFVEDQFTIEDMLILTPSATQAIVAGTGITAAMVQATPLIRVEGSGGAVTVTATPSVADGAADGQLVLIQGDSDVNTVTLQDESGLANSGLALAGGANMVLGKGDMLLLSYDSGDDKWYEVSRSDN